MITDSGGLQEETTYLGIPCFTLRENTERPITVEQGTNRLASPGFAARPAGGGAGGGVRPPRSGPEYWDGKTAARCLADLRLRDGRRD